MEKVISEKSELIAKVEVSRGVRAVVNPNGRGYDSDNVVRYLNDEVTKFTVKASTADKLTEKVGIMLGTIEEN